MGFIDTSVAIVRTGSELFSLKFWSLGHSFAGSVWNGSVASSRLTDILKVELESDLGQSISAELLFIIDKHFIIADMYN